MKNASKNDLKGEVEMFLCWKTAARNKVDGLKLENQNNDLKAVKLLFDAEGNLQFVTFSNATLHTL